MLYMEIEETNLVLEGFKGTSEFGTLITLLKCAVGSGLLALPYAYS